MKYLHTKTSMAIIYRSHNQTNGNLGDICNGYFVKQELESTSNIPLLQLVAYYDGVELANPLGSKTKKHHISLLYFMIANIHPAKRSAYQAINLVAVCKTKHLKVNAHMHSPIHCTVSAQNTHVHIHTCIYVQVCTFLQTFLQ